MIILYKCQSAKVRWRKQSEEIKIIIHQNTIDRIILSNDADLINYITSLLDHPYKDSDDVYKLFDIDRSKYQSYIQNIKYWSKIFEDLPKVKFEGRVRKGEHQIYNNIYIKSRSAERREDQVLELIYKIEKNDLKRNKANNSGSSI